MDKLDSINQSIKDVKAKPSRLLDAPYPLIAEDAETEQEERLLQTSSGDWIIVICLWLRITRNV